ncbi:hypothetical protein L596_009163 [Steinernema carpocapsae]|uniref:Uncharacterized protein n=1 Tax=Steinernema carpocapsae TaxID=34508 RepID=A0A4U5PEJ9_STECR|nr:hypothetical protein L596_009163 [Steinernema carpocapsae]
MVGVVSVAIFKGAHLVARQFLPFVMTLFILLTAISILALHPLVNFFIQTNAPEEWAMLFYILCGIMVAFNVFFCFTCKTEAATWTKTQSCDMVQPSNQDILHVKV